MKIIWKDIKNYEGHYQINNLGEVKSIKFNKELIMKPKTNRQGYLEYELRKPNEKSITVSAHRLVAMHFIENPFNYPVVNHIDGDKQNNLIENLEWCDYSHNNQHAYDTGLNAKTKSVLVYSLEGDFIGRFPSITQACKKLDIKLTQRSNITNCCKGKVASVSNYIWRYSHRGFEIVSEANRKFPSEEPKLPTRGTSKAMAYDFYAPTDYVVAPNEIVKIWTDVKAYMQDTEGLILNVRSSMGGKFMLANTQGWIDADYYNNENNEGNIGIFLKNISDVPLLIQKGERIAQGMFIPFLVADNGNTDRIREGGFGHTNDTPKNS